jgi:dTDP-4-dehydrorhamnose 3,5-epimerase
MCVSGAVLDFIVDVRVGSPTFGQWESVRLDDVGRKALYLAEGLGHAFVALTEGACVSYLVSDTFRPSVEFAIDPFDPAIGIDYPADLGPLSVSPKDADAVSLAVALKNGLLPTWEDAQERYSFLDSKVSE